MQQNNLIAPIIVAIGVIIAAVAFAMVTTLLESADSAADLRLTRLEAAFDAEAAQRAEVGEVGADQRAERAGDVGHRRRLRIRTAQVVSMDRKPAPVDVDVTQQALAQHGPSQLRQCLQFQQFGKFGRGQAQQAVGSVGQHTGCVCHPCVTSTR